VLGIEKKFERVFLGSKGGYDKDLHEVPQNDTMKGAMCSFIM